MSWVPLSMQSDPDLLAGYETLVEGLPDYVRPDIALTIEAALTFIPNPREYLRLLGLRLRRTFPRGWESVLTSIRSDDDALALDLLDGFLKVTSDHEFHFDLIEHVEETLRLGGSAWTLGVNAQGLRCLQRRVDVESLEAFEQERTAGGNASVHLTAAWHSVYGRNPNPSDAYGEAVKAVEAIGKPIITPTDSLATLGKMVSAVDSKPLKWVVTIGTVPHVADMMRALLKGQHDRHGDDDESAPIYVSAEEAEAAVHLAVLLVNWFRTGKFTRSPGS